MKRPLLLASAVVLLGVGCEKAKSSSGTPSGAATKDEIALLQHIPRGNNVLFGGSFDKFQGFLQGNLFEELMGLTGQGGPGARIWSECFLGYKVQMVGGVAASGRDIRMDFAMNGITAQQVAECGKKASYSTTLDPDGKWVEVEMPSVKGPNKTGYLVAADGILVGHNEFEMGAMPGPPERVKTESVQASLSSGTASDDTKLVSAMAAIDRKRALWFVGSAENTPLSDKFSEISGWMEMDKGLAFDVTLVVTSEGLADQVASSIPQLKQGADMLGPEVADVVKGLRFEKSGKRLHVGLAISEAQLKAMIEKLKPMMGAMGGMGR